MAALVNSEAIQCRNPVSNSFKELKLGTNAAQGENTVDRKRLAVAIAINGWIAESARVPTASHSPAVATKGFIKNRKVLTARLT
jgi:hypothetical protein